MIQRIISAMLLLTLIPSGSCLAGQDKNGRQIMGPIKEEIAAVKQDDYEKAESIFHAVMQASRLAAWKYEPFSTFIDAGTPEDDPGYLDHLNKWILSQPDSAAPFLLRAEYTYKNGWFVRGRGFAVQVPYERMHRFIEAMHNAQEDISESIKRDDLNPYSRLLQLLIARGNASGEDTVRIFEAAVKKYPDYFALYAERLTELTPRWGGSVAQMIGFTSHYTAGLPKDSSLRILPIVLYKDLVQELHFNCAGYPEDKLPACNQRMSDLILGADMENRLRQAFDLYSHTDRFEFNRFVILSLLNSKSLFRPPFNKISRIAGEALGDDNYAMNMNYGNFYLEEGDYPQAIQYLGKALQEMEAFPFPAEEDKTDLMGSVYSQMADTYLALKQPELSIFYAGKAIDLDNRKPAFYTIRCGAYLQKGKYPKALADCNKALAGSPDERAAGYKALLDRLMPVQ